MKVQKNMHNVTLYYKLANIFNLSSLAQATLRGIERCFTFVVETNNFLKLDFSLVRKILSSSELHTTSEIEVFNIVNDWINYNTEERSKFAKDLLLKVRLHLLSDHALNYLLWEKYHICSIAECRAMVQNVLLNKNKLVKSNSYNSYTSRYCSQNLFNITFCENHDYSLDKKKLIIVNGNKLKSTKTFYSIGKKEKLCNATCLKGEICIFVKNNLIKNTMTIKKFSITSNVWENLGDLNYRIEFCVCVFINTIFIIGGHINHNLFDYCLQYDTKGPKFKEVSGMNQAKYGAACTVFQGHIVVSGGYIRDIQAGFPLMTYTNTVELYDHVDDKWSCMPSMVNRTARHSLVAIKNKLFVLGYSCEVFDNFSQSFVLMKQQSLISDLKLQHLVGAIPIANKIIVFRKNKSKVVCYDIKKEEWSEEEIYDETKNYFESGCCIKQPQIY